MKSAVWIGIAIAVTAITSTAAETPVGMLVETEPLGRGSEGTVMGLVVQVAPEDRTRVGGRVQISASLAEDDQVVDRYSTVVSLDSDGSVLLFREWKVGRYELRVRVNATDSEASGLWVGEIVVPDAENQFVAPEGATPDAIALAITPAEEQAVKFLPPPNLGGIGAVQLEVETPEETASVEFFKDGEPLGRRNRPPWTVSIPLGEIVRRSTVKAVARTADGDFLGEDALVLNSPTGQLGVEILLAPTSSISGGKRKVTVAVTGASQIRQVSLAVDDRTVARWVECPCVTEVPVRDLDQATILSADALDSHGARGDAVLTMLGQGGFAGSVRVELVELPVTVLDARGAPVVGLTQQDFRAFEDEAAVTLEGFGTTAELPLSLAIAMDISGSMEEEFAEVRRAVSGFADGLLRPGDSLTFLTFSWEPKVEIPWTEDFSQLERTLEREFPEGGTSLHDAVVSSLEQFRGRRGRQAVVLLTDGEDTTSRTDWRVAERFAQTMRVPIFPIGLGIGALRLGGRGVLKDLAEATGGEAFFPKKADDLPAVYARIDQLLRSQYLLWYLSNSTKPLEEFRTIRVEVSRPDAVVRTIRGYYPGK